MKKGKNIIILAICVVLIGVAIYMLFIKNMFNNKTELHQINEDVAKKAIGLYYDNSDLLAYSSVCSLAGTDGVMAFSKYGKNFYKVNNYQSWDSLKQFLSEWMTSEMIEQYKDRFEEKDNNLYCFVPSMAFAYVNQDSISISNIRNENNEMLADVDYTVGDNQSHIYAQLYTHVVGKSLEDLRYDCHKSCHHH